MTAADRANITSRILTSYPNSSVVAIGENGLFVPMPPAVPLVGQTTIQGHTSALELVVQSDVVNVIEAWKRAPATARALSKFTR
jgi:hypothetical protein